MKQKFSTINIYEKKGVYGSEDKYKNSNRLDKMIEIIKNLKFKPKKILDIGCGTGFLTNEVKRIYPDAEVHGIDISKKALLIGKNKYKNIIFIHADAEKKLPFKNSYFDLIISGEHIEHLSDVDNYLLEINRIISSKGILVLTTPNLSSWMNRILLAFGKQPYYLDPSLRITLPIFTLFGKTFPDNLNSYPAGHLRLYTLNMLKKLLKAYGFKTEKSYGRWMLSKPILKQLDVLFSFLPSTAFGLILVASRARKVNGNER